MTKDMCIIQFAKIFGTFTYDIRYALQYIPQIYKLIYTDIQRFLVFRIRQQCCM